MSEQYTEGTRVETPHGEGVIIGIDLPESRAWRYICKLKSNPFSYDQVCYSLKEIQKIKEDTNEL